jgi:hypothetical protein
MKNVEIKIDSKKKVLTIEIDLTKGTTVSASGKTLIVASTEGNSKIGFEDWVLGLNCYRANPEKPSK